MHASQIVPRWGAGECLRKLDKAMTVLRKQIKENLGEIAVRYDEPMARHTSFRIGGPADVLLLPASLDELRACLRFVRDRDLPCFLLGGGTNVLVADRGVRGVVIGMSGLAKVWVDGARMVAQAGAAVEQLCVTALQHALAGIEFLHGLPGTVGGAAWMNARCYGGSIADVLKRAKVMDENLEVVTIECSPEDFGYKRSPFQTMAGCICQVELRLTRGDRETILRRMNENHADRVEKGHFSAPSAGSLFKNNRAFGAPTGRILDELGLRGSSRGAAAIAPYHGNIFINQGQATAADMLELIRLAVETADRRKRIRLEPEVRFVGDWRPGELDFLDPKVSASRL